MPKTKTIALYVVVALVVTTLASCYHQPHKYIQLPSVAESHTSDTLSSYQPRHYGQNFNFKVMADSLSLILQQPEELLSGMPTDSFVVRHGDRLVVADFRVLPSDTPDTVWVQVANAEQQFGWTLEANLLRKVVPDDPISEFISTFSDTHLLIFLIVISVISCAYLMRKLMKMNAPIVHFRDIHSFYPTLLTLIVAASATFYASIQMFAPELWQHFYFHPTLNPFSVPPMLSIFLISAWSMLIVGIAAVDDVRSQLAFGEAVTYLLGLAAICAFNYIVFSITTLYYIGYLLLALYVYYAVLRYLEHGRSAYICGNCGAKIHKKGICPRCGALNE